MNDDISKLKNEYLIAHDKYKAAQERYRKAIIAYASAIMGQRAIDKKAEAGEERT
jgi:hypothetical protein